MFVAHTAALAALPLLLFADSTAGVGAKTTVVQQYMQYRVDVYKLSGREIVLLG